MTPPRFFEVECLRGLAIGLVVVHHANGFLYGGFPPALGMLPWPAAAVVLTGYTGVDLFFVLSGFLLSRPFLAEARGGRWSVGPPTPSAAPSASCRSTSWPSPSRASWSRSARSTFSAARRTWSS